MNKLLPAVLIAILVSCGSEPEPKLFTLLSPEETGVHFNNELATSPEMNILEYLYFYNGGGVAVGDVNNDGLADIYFTSNQGENKLYLNLGDFTFKDITQEAGVGGDGGWSTGTTFADVNGDGLLDIYVCQVGDYKNLTGVNKLYINNGDLTFKESAAAYGLNFVGFSTHAVFFDYDQDGDLDMYLLNHSIKKPEVFSHADTKFTTTDAKGGDKLFKNLWSEGESRFQEVTTEAGILSSSLGFGLGVGIGDVNGDGWLDIYVSNDFTEDDYLFINQQDGTFAESLSDYIDYTSRYSMGNDLADINNDGLVDIFTTDMLPNDPRIWMKSVGEDKQEVYDIKQRLGYGDQYVRNHLQLNRGSGKFSEIGLLTETFATDWSWSPLIFDMDNDGFKDIHVTNGIVKRPNDLDFIQYSQELSPQMSELEIQQKQGEIMPTVKLANFTFKNTGNLQFEDIGKKWGLDQLSYSNGSAYADLDNDGDLDLIINNTNQKAFLYRNHTNDTITNHFIQVDLKSDQANVFGIGAQVAIFSQGASFHQTLSTSRGFQSGGATTLTFGIGDRQSVDSIRVVWQADEVEVFHDISTDQRVLLVKGEGKKTTRYSREQRAFLEIADIAIDWSHEENNAFDEFRREYLLPRRYGTEGPALAVGDVNRDGLDDIFFGGAKGQPSRLYLQQPNGSFEKAENPFFEQMKTAEDVVATFADFNQDGFLDLYIGSGGNEYASGELFNFDRLFLNDWKGNLRFSPNSLPPNGENTSTVAVHDVNGDGYPDIFVGSSVVTGNYGALPSGFLLINDGKGKFRDMTAEYFPGFHPGFHPGMVQAAQWADVDGDGAKELLLTGEWMGLQVYKLSPQGKFEMNPELSFEKAGWYTALTVEDLDGNGQQDILLGNLGQNSKLKASEERPVWLYHHDFDGNEQDDPILFHYMDKFLVPFASRDDLIKQISRIKKMHGSYAEYAEIDQPEALFDKDQLAGAARYKVEELRSGILWRSEGIQDSFVPLPVEAQFSPIRDFISFAKGDKKYVLAIGNFFGFRNDFGKSAAQPIVLMEVENQALKYIPLNIPANRYWGEYRHIAKIDIGGVPHLLAVRNNDRPVFFKLGE